MPQSYDQLYELIEKSFNVEEVNTSSIEAWLVQGKEGGKIKSGFDREGKQRYAESKGISSSGRTNIRGFAEKVGVTGEIYDEADIEGNIDKLKKLKNKAKDLDVYSSEVVTKVEEAISTAEEVKIQEQEILEKESGDFLIKEFKEAETVEERKELQRELKEELPDSLRSLKGWETRKGRLAFQSVFFD